MASGIGLVFPGQGSQYPGMLREIAATYPTAQKRLAELDPVGRIGAWVHYWALRPGKLIGFWNIH